MSDTPLPAANNPPSALDELDRTVRELRKQVTRHDSKLFKLGSDVDRLDARLVEISLMLEQRNERPA